MNKTLESMASLAREQFSANRAGRVVEIIGGRRVECAARSTFRVNRTSCGNVGPSLTWKLDGRRIGLAELADVVAGVAQ